MRSLELGLLLPIGGGRWDEVERVPRLRDAAGFDVLWVGDDLAERHAAAPWRGRIFFSTRCRRSPIW